MRGLCDMCWQSGVELTLIDDDALCNKCVRIKTAKQL